jgi:hypothetical protein
LTDWGRQLKPIVLSLGGWAVRSPSFPGDDPVSVDSVVLALLSFFDRDAPEGFSATFELRLDEDRFRVRISDERIDLDRGSAEAPDAIIETDVETLREVVWQGRKLSETLRAGEIRIEGDRRAVTRFVGLFPQPETAVPAAAAAKPADRSSRPGG